MDDAETPSSYLDFDRHEWGRLLADTQAALGECDLDELRLPDAQVTVEEVECVYLPLARLLNLQNAAAQQRHDLTGAFLGNTVARVPFVVGLAGSVAVGKSTISRLLGALLACWQSHPRVEVITTDGFLFPNSALEARGLMSRKGFPESYDVARLVSFLAELKSGAPLARAPSYSHVVYDVIEDEEIVLARPDIVLLEGLNVLQVTPPPGSGGTQQVVSDFLDFAIYIDADEEDIQRWYVERFLALRASASLDPESFFGRFAGLSDVQARSVAERIWETINGVNLRESISPTRSRANLILEKGQDHLVRRVRLRRH